MIMTEQQIREFELKQAMENNMSATKQSKDKIIKKLSKPPSVLLKEKRLKKLKVAATNAELKLDVLQAPISNKESTSSLKNNRTKVDYLS